jgi:ankyrin repeat protein
MTDRLHKSQRWIAAIGIALSLIAVAGVGWYISKQLVPLNLEQAVRKEDVAAVHKALQRGTTEEERGNALLRASRIGNAELVMALLNGGASASYCAPKQLTRIPRSDWSRDTSPHFTGGETALHCAGRNPHPDVAKMLILGGADVNACDAEGLTPLQWVFNDGVRRSDKTLDFIQTLLEQGADPLKKSDNDDYETPLVWPSGGATATQ